MLASFFQTRSTHLPFPGDLSCLVKMQRKWTFANWDMMIMMPGILANFVNDDSSDCKSWCQIFIIHYWIFILRKQHTNSNTKSHSVDYNLLPQVILFIRETWKCFVFNNFGKKYFQEPELCPECPELPYSTDTKFWSQNPYVENSYGNENSYPVQNFNYGLNSFGATDDLIEIPPDPFSHQSYSRRIDSLALDALDIGGSRNGVQVVISEDLLKHYSNFLSKCKYFQIQYSDYCICWPKCKYFQIRRQQPFLSGTLMPAPSSQWKPLLKYKWITKRPILVGSFGYHTKRLLPGWENYNGKRK